MKLNSSASKPRPLTKKEQRAFQTVQKLTTGQRGASCELIGNPTQRRLANKIALRQKEKKKVDESKE